MKPLPKTLRRLAILSFGLASTFGLVRDVSAQARPIVWSSAMAVGAATDTLAREVAQLLATRTGQTIVVENAAGGGGVVAVNKVRVAPADGQNFLFISNSLIAGQAMRKAPDVDLAKDLAAISPLFEGTFGIFIAATVPANNLKELLAYAKGNPGKMNYGSSGIGGVMHLFVEDLKARAQVDMLHIPYTGGAPVLADMVGGRVQLALMDIGLGNPQVDAGKLKLVAVTSKNRFPGLPNVPTADESGLPGYTPTFWFGLYAKAGTPKATLDKVNDDLRAILTNAETRQRYAARGYVASWMSPDDTQKRVLDELALLNKTIDALKIERQ